MAAAVGAEMRSYIVAGAERGHVIEAIVGSLMAARAYRTQAVVGNVDSKSTLVGAFRCPVIASPSTPSSSRTAQAS